MSHACTFFSGIGAGLLTESVIEFAKGPQRPSEIALRSTVFFAAVAASVVGDRVRATRQARAARVANAEPPAPGG